MLERRLSPAGYARLIRDHALACLPPHHTSYIASRDRRATTIEGGAVEDVFPPRYAPDDGLVPQVEFALKYDGLELGVLRSFFTTVNRDSWESELIAALHERKTGVHLRRIWYLYELLTGRELQLPNATIGPYVPLADPEQYFTAAPRRSRRHRVDDNLLGVAGFSPMVRRSPMLASFAGKRLSERAREIVAAYDTDALHRAIAWLYTKETRSSYAIEHEYPSLKRVERFVQLLRQAPKVARLDQQTLVELQRATVDPRFANDGWRDEQVYVGETVGYAQRVHYIAPKPEDLPDLMAAFLEMSERLEGGTVDPVVAAAVVSFGFVFLHPFSDGNGRLHRFLIHRVLARHGFVPNDLIFPVSAVMLDRRPEYDRVLESFSRPLMELLDYDLDKEGRLTVAGDTAGQYRTFDATPIAEALYAWIERTVETDLRAELEFLTRFRAARLAVQEIVDVPDNLLDLFVVLVMQNQGRLSASKRKAKFGMLTDAEIDTMEAAVRAV